ncbi:hypothetical protein E4U43_003607 [Claviceps pusilla]|uniref:Uncharacterized protein n=1 Tax=Claviceps pusilla TaxID=123648 RepID=A0A9P7SXK8_9HYPO|nr:hypothetical protein E4U43_003607 [Claviceps pusilla]
MKLLLKDAARSSQGHGTAFLRRATRVTPLRSILLLTVLLVYILRFSVLEYGDYVLQIQPWSGQRQLEQAFTPTEAELKCLHGSSNATIALTSTSSPSSSLSTSSSQADPIPNVVHFIYIFREPLALRKGLQFGFLEYLAIRSAIVSLQSPFIFLHYAFVHKNGDGSSKMRMDPMSNPWIRRLRNNLVVIEHQLGNVKGQSISYLRDVMSLQLLRDNGGIFLDLNTFALKPFTTVLNPPRSQGIVLGHAGGNRWGLGNGAIAARKNSTLLHQWLHECQNGPQRRRWTYKTNSFPTKLADKTPRGVCALPPDAFFWPTWTWTHVEWMHEELDGEQAKHWTAEIEKNGGALFAGQLAYHAWDHGSAGRHLRDLTPDMVRRRNTRFNLLVRRFIEDDVD